MNLQEAMSRYRTLVLEGRDGLDRDEALTELTHGGFHIRRIAGTLHHLDPARPYRELLTGSERLALDGGMVRELVYGPLRRGHSRVTWIQALDFAEAVAERDGALLHLKQAPGMANTCAAPAMAIRSRTHPAAATSTTTGPDGIGASGRIGAADRIEEGDESDRGEEVDAACAAYDRAFRTLAQHVPIVTIPAATTAAGRRMSGNTGERFPVSR